MSGEFGVGVVDDVCVEHDSGEVADEFRWGFDGRRGGGLTSRSFLAGGLLMKSL